MSDSRPTPEHCQHVEVNADNQSLYLAQGPVPTPGAKEVLIRVHNAGVNRADLMQRAGHYPPPEDASPILGLEVAGIVTATGDEVSNWQVGDRICALTHGGGYAEYAVAPVGQCLPIPSGFSDAEGAALPEALLTMWHNLFQRAALKRGERVLIHGGASGMGTVGIMICAAMGAQVYTTAGTDAKCEALEARGATRAINYKTHDFEEVLLELGLANGIDVILDMIGGDYIQKNLNLAAAEGRIVSIAFMRGVKAEVNFAALLMKRVTMTGSTLRAQSFEQKAVMVEDIMAHVFPHLEDGSIRPIIDSTFPLSEAEAAHERMQSGEHMGKIVLVTTGS
ncbi:MAG: NAD(P)H-quinone oxidoreductase [Halioglobus sp.]|nr:NAD(P)H-quinone oxidoreductase [Halioglobus sp.]